MVTISEELLGIIIPAAVVLLVIMLIVRLKLMIRKTIKNEIYDHFPTIKNKIEDFGRQVEFFKLEIVELERRMKEIEKKQK